MADKRQEIESAATNAIRTGGLSSVSFRMLADEVGVKSSSVHYHFPTKADLAEAVVRSYTEAFEAELQRILREESTLRGRLYSLVSTFEQVREMDQLCLCGAVAAEAASIDANTRRAVGTFFSKTADWIVSAVEEGRQQLATDIDHQDIARILTASLEGANLIDRAVGKNKHLDSVRLLIDSLTTD